MLCPHCGKHIDADRESEYAKSKPTTYKTVYRPFDVEVVAFTKNAMLLHIAALDFEDWFPRSQIKNGPSLFVQKGDTFTAELSEYICGKKGIQ